MSLLTVIFEEMSEWEYADKQCTVLSKTAAIPLARPYAQNGERTTKRAKPAIIARTVSTKLMQES